MNIAPTHRGNRHTQIHQIQVGQGFSDGACVGMETLPVSLS